MQLLDCFNHVISQFPSPSFTHKSPVPTPLPSWFYPCPYLTLVRPILEYASPVWDPHLIKDSDQIEKVQRAASAARWVILDYSWSSSVTTMLNNLNWPTLSLCRKISKLQIFYKAAIHNLTALPIPDYFLHVSRFTRNYQSYVVPS